LPTVCFGQTQVARDSGVRAAAARARQDDSSALGQRLRGRRPSRPALQGVAFAVGERQHGDRTADGHERSPFYRENARGLLLQVLYTIRSERLLMEQLDYNLLFCWLIGLEMNDPVWDHSVVTKNRERLLAGVL
jgi:hypothetical protein